MPSIFLDYICSVTTKHSNMKKINLLLILLMLSSYASSQTVTVRAVSQNMKDAKADTLDNATIRCYYKFTQPVTIEKEKLQVTDTMTLDIGYKCSQYYDATRRRRDSIFGSTMQEQLGTGGTSNIKSISVLKNGDMSALGNVGTTFESTSKGETARLYKNRSNQELITIDQMSNSRNKYKLLEKKLSQQWEISTDTLTILGYLCQKATTSFRGRKYEVWFTPDIPINDGPWKFYGLPGLILKAVDSENLFSFEIIGLEQLSEPAAIRIIDEEYINCSRKDMANLRKKRTGGMAVNINGGNITMVHKNNNSEYTPLEID